MLNSSSLICSSRQDTFYYNFGTFVVIEAVAL